LDAAGLTGASAPKIVMGENVVHAFTMAATGNTDVSLVALSTVLTSEAGARGRFVGIPPTLHAPIRQDGLLLAHGRSNEAALAFIRYLQSDEVQRRLAALGYQAERS
jgi:molybdate transport system substrate-binding protein